MSVETVWKELGVKNAKPSIQEILESGKFLVSGEIGPPKGPDIEEVIEHVDLMKDKVHAMNITDNQSSVMRYPSLATAIIILERGGEPNLQVTCRDRNRMSLENELLFAYTRGVRSVLCLTGDSVPVGDHKEAKSVFDLESVQLLNMIRTMEEGNDLGGNEMNAPVKFYKGAIVTPEAPADRAAAHQVREEGRGRGGVVPDPGDLRHGQLREVHEDREAIPRQDAGWVWCCLLQPVWPST